MRHQMQRIFILGLFIIVLTACGGAANQAGDGNASPVARIGDDFVVQLGTPILLDPSASSDPDGGSLTVEWHLDAVPVGSALEGAEGVINVAELTEDDQYELVADVVGEYVVTLIVGDGEATATDTITITVKELVADMGGSQSIVNGVTATVDVGASYLVGDGELTWVLNFLQVPVGSSFDGMFVEGDMSDTVMNFDLDVNGEYSLSLQLTEGNIVDETFITILVAENPGPVADAGDGGKVYFSPITLNGEGSFGPLGISSYQWRLIAKPASSARSIGAGSITNANQVIATFSPDVFGDYTFSLKVTDPDGLSHTSAVTYRYTELFVPPIIFDPPIIIGF